MLLEERLSKILKQLDLFQMPERNARSVELYRGLDGKGTRTFEEVQDIIAEEFEDSIGRERIRILGQQGIDAFKQKFVWNAFFESLYDFVLEQSPIEYSLLSNRVCDPNYDSFSSSKSHYKPFSESPFDTSGLMKILELRPSKYNGTVKTKLDTKRLTYSYQRKKLNIGEPTPRNSIHACRFVIPAKFKVNLDTLISHAERGVKFNGMLQESSLIPLMPVSLPIFKREELAHSLVVNNKDFLWLDQERGWFTFTCHLENRITNIVAKIFQATASIPISLLAHLVTRAARLQKEVLKGEAANEDFKIKSEYLKEISFGSGAPEFSVRDAELTLVRTGLCSIDRDGVLTPTELFKPMIEKAELLDTTKVFISVLKEAPDGVLSQSDFRERALNAKAKFEMPNYLSTVTSFIEDGIFSKNGEYLTMDEDGRKIFMSTSKENVFCQREALNDKLTHYNELNVVSVAAYKAKLAEVKDSTRLVRQQLKTAKDTADSALLVGLEEEFQNLLLMSAVCLPPMERTEELTKAMTRSKKNLNRFKKAKVLDRVKFEQERLEHIEYQFRLIDAFSDNEAFDSFFAQHELDELNPHQYTKLFAEKFNYPYDSTLEEFCESYYIRCKLSQTTDELQSLPAPNDKYRNLVFEIFEEGATLTNDTYWQMLESDLSARLLERAYADELNHAQAHYNQHIAYSPLIYRVDWAKYTYVGNKSYPSYYQG